ncbi:hypothetical protein CS063_06200 [Sporanaerobium hydrogeniformans]|uniref:Uncharacterized protein n=1 Tax=Sporanaerobium hydrogeniformans TaxID=3072179 RepID=A0AC61DD81_9FIRM|nr:DUF4330 domain-containing protein [Sporanaerobium hydrogeniformans]PHV71279.1 hypothetical protein CS063_06200 [Sporanaerobium hydrogeniformans]
MSKEINKKKMKFNIIDVVVIIVLIVAFIIGSRILGLGKKMGIGMEETKATFTVELRDAPLELFNQMQVGDEVNIAIDSVDYGRITAISEPEPTMVQAFDTTTGKYNFVAPQDPRYTAYITIEANANESDASVLVGNTEVKVGKAIFVKGKGYSGKGYVVELDTASTPNP